MNDQVDLGRRRLLTAATVGTGAIGVAFAAVPFLASWQPSARAKALGAPVEVDASKLEAGQMLKVVWRGQAVFVVRRVKSVIDQLGNHDAVLADPKSDDSTQPDYIKASGAVRARNPEYWVGLAVCTHLGCSPLGAFEANNSYPSGRRRLGEGLARRLLLPVSWLEIRYLRPGLQEHAGAQESGRAALRVREQCANHHRRRRRRQDSLAKRFTRWPQHPSPPTAAKAVV